MDKLKSFERAINDPRKVRAARLLVDNDFASKGERRTLDEIGEEVGVSRQTLFNWNKEDLFIGYKNLYTDVTMQSDKSAVYSQLRKAIMGTSNNGVPSIKAIELWMKKHGEVVNKAEVNYTEEPNVTSKNDIDKMREELDDLLSDQKEN